MFITHSLNGRSSSNLFLLFSTSNSTIDDDEKKLGTPELLDDFRCCVELWRSEFVNDLPEQRKRFLTMTVGNVFCGDVAENLVFSFLESFQCQINVVYLLQA